MKIDHRIWSWAEPRRLAELAKCVVRCHPCHLAKTVAAAEFSHGEQHLSAKLTSDAVQQIRALLAIGWSRSRIGRSFGVSKSTVHSISKRRTWGHLA